MVKLTRGSGLYGGKLVKLRRSSYLLVLPGQVASSLNGNLQVTSLWSSYLKLPVRGHQVTSSYLKLPVTVKLHPYGQVTSWQRAIRGQVGQVASVKLPPSFARASYLSHP